MTEYEIKENLAYNLKEIRRFFGKTQGEFATEIGVTRPNVGSWEEKRAMPKFEILYSLSRAYMTTVDHLVFNKLTELELTLMQSHIADIQYLKAKKDCQI